MSEPNSTAQTPPVHDPSLLDTISRTLSRFWINGFDMAGGAPEAAGIPPKPALPPETAFGNLAETLKGGVVLSQSEDGGSFSIKPAYIESKPGAEFTVKF